MRRLHCALRALLELDDYWLDSVGGGVGVCLDNACTPAALTGSPSQVQPSASVRTCTLADHSALASFRLYPGGMQFRLRRRSVLGVPRLPNLAASVQTMACLPGSKA